MNFYRSFFKCAWFSFL